MTNDSIVTPIKRIPRFAGIETPPQLLFAVNDGKHQQSVKIVDGLAKTYFQNSGPSPLCLIFDGWDALPEDISVNSVLVFDSKLGKHCFSPLCWHMNAGRRKFPHFCRTEVLWGFAVNSNLRDSRIASAINQLKADFGKNFLDQLNQEKFPWGDVPVMRKKQQKRAPKEKRLLKEDPLYFAGAWNF